MAKVEKETSYKGNDGTVSNTKNINIIDKNYISSFTKILLI